MLERYYYEISLVRNIEDLQKVLNLLCDLLPNCFAAITFRDEKNLVRLDKDILDYTILANIESKYVSIYDDHFRDRDSFAYTEMDAGKILGTAKFESFLDVFTEKPFMYSEFYNEFLLSLGIDDSVILNLFSVGSLNIRLNLYFKSNKIDQENAMSYLNQLAPLIQMAVKYVFLTDDNFKEVFESKLMVKLLSDKYGLSKGEATALYQYGTQLGTLEEVAKRNGKGAENFRKQKQDAVKKVNYYIDCEKLKNRLLISQHINKLKDEAIMFPINAPALKQGLSSIYTGRLC